MKWGWFARGVMLLAALSSLSISLPAAPVSGQTGTGGHQVFLPIVSEISSAPPSSSSVIIPPTTKVLPPDTTAELVSISQDGVTYTYSASTPALASLQPGDVMVAGITPKTPAGILRKVTGVSQSGQTVVVQTAPATLVDAITKGSIHVSKTITPANVVSQTLMPGVTPATQSHPAASIRNGQARIQNISFVSGPSPSAVDVSQGFFYDLSQIVLYDKDGNRKTTNDQVRIDTGNIGIQPVIQVDASWDHDLSPDITLTVGGKENVDLTLAALISNDFNDKVNPLRVNLATFILDPIEIQVGWVPVVIFPVLHLHVGVDGKVMVGVTSQVSQSSTITACGHFANWNVVNCKGTISNSFQTSPPQIVAGTQAQVYGGPDLSALIEGMADVDVSCDAYLRLVTDALSPVWWKVYGGFQVPVDFQLKVFTWKVLPKYTMTISMGVEKLLWQFNVPPSPPSAPAPPDGAADQPANLKLGWQPSTDLNGDPVTYSVLLDTANPPVKQAASSQSGASFAASGLQPGVTYYWRVVAADPHGASTNGPVWSFTILPPPTPTPTPTPTSPPPPPPPPLTAGLAIAAGNSHTCALTSTGGDKCWGVNSAGEMGDGTTNAAFSPVNVVGLSSGTHNVTAGQYHSCAVTASGGAVCWGLNTFGEVGDGTLNSSLVPVNVTGLASGVQMVSAGNTHTCALTTAGGVKCWGFNYLGELGNGATASEKTPVDVIGLTSGVQMISAGAEFNCALTSSDGVKCWGRNYEGQLGNGSTETQSSVPVDVTGLTSGVIAVASGFDHACALTSAGGVKCWGNNTDYQLGDGTTTQRNTPVDVVGLSSGVIAVSAEFDNTCALLATGGIKCWGSNLYGAIGDGTTTDRPTPVDVVGLSTSARAVAVGGDHVCAAMTDGSIECWGSNSNGQLGNGSQTDSFTPVPVVGFP